MVQKIPACAPNLKLSSPTTSYQDFNNLFLFSRLLNLSTRFLCILTSIFSYRSRSALAVRLSRIIWMRVCYLLISHTMNTQIAQVFADLPLGFFSFLHVSFLGLRGCLSFYEGDPLLIGRPASRRPEWCLPFVPVFTCERYTCQI